MEKGSTSRNCCPSCLYGRVSKWRQSEALGGVIGSGTHPGHPSSSGALSPANSSRAARYEHSIHMKSARVGHGLVPGHTAQPPARHCWVLFQGAEPAHTCTVLPGTLGNAACWPWLWQTPLPTHPSFPSSSLLPKHSHHPRLKPPCQLQSGSVPPKIADNEPFVLVLALCFSFKITSSPGSASVYVAARPSIICVGFPCGLCLQACGHISPAFMFLNKQLSHCFPKGLSCLIRKSFICALVHSWLLCLCDPWSISVGSGCVTVATWGILDNTHTEMFLPSTASPLPWESPSLASATPTWLHTATSAQGTEKSKSCSSTGDWKTAHFLQRCWI